LAWFRLSPGRVLPGRWPREWWRCWTATIRVNIRIRGIDAPEMKSRCAGEHSAALEARDVLADLLQGGEVSISNIGSAKYYGRVLADVATRDGEDVGPILLDLGLARPYWGGGRAGWCG